jgi:hypothetical protein
MTFTPSGRYHRGKWGQYAWFYWQFKRYHFYPILLIENALERFKNTVAIRGEGMGSGLFGFWRRFGSVTGFSNMLLRRSLAKTPKILAPNGHIIF